MFDRHHGHKQATTPDDAGWNGHPPHKSLDRKGYPYR